MSAFVVGREHIRFLVSAAQTRGRYGAFSYHWNGERRTLAPDDRDAATRIGQLLWDENIRSVEGRYPDCKGNRERMPGPVGEVFIYSHSAGWPGPLEAVQVLKACDCFEYQSCEHPEWEASEAKAFVDALRRKAWHSLPGYDAAAWEVHKQPA